MKKLALALMFFLHLITYSARVVLVVDYRTLTQFQEKLNATLKKELKSNEHVKSIDITMPERGYYVACILIEEE